MAEESRPWPGMALGDAGPYSDDDWDNTWEVLFGSGLAPYNDRGVIRNWLNELEVTDPVVANRVDVDTGAALVHGKFYRNTVLVNVTAIPNSVGAWREDLVCLQADWVTETIRIYRYNNPTDGVAYPAPTQTDGVIWEIPLAAVRIDNAGVITLITDLREFAYDLMHVAPAARVYRDSDQAIPHPVRRALSFNVERFDNDGIWDIANPTRLTCQTPGIYQISLTVTWELNNVGVRSAGIWESVSGLHIAIESEDAQNIFGASHVVSTLYELAQGQFVEAKVYQNSGGWLNIESYPQGSPEFMMVKVA